MGSVLIVIDYENEWINKESSMFIGDISGKIKRVNKLIGFCRKKHVPIIFTTHIEEGSSTGFAKGTKGVEIIKDVDFRKSKDILIKKHRVSPFFKTGLDKRLKELKADKLIITGILTNLCVRSCASDAYDRDYNITVIEDTCAAFSAEIHDFTIKDMKETRPEINFLMSREFMERDSKPIKT